MIHQNQRTLILNSTFHPLSVVSYKRAIALIYSKKINSLKDKVNFSNYIQFPLQIHW